MTRREWLRIGAGVLLVVALAWALMAGLGRLLRTPTDDAAPDGGPEATAPAVERPVPHIKATLYFAAADGLHLVGIEREVPLGDTLVAQARAIVEAQIAAAAPPPLAPVIPAGTALRGLYVSDAREVFVDLEGGIRGAHRGGAVGELLTTYALTHALLANLPTLASVRLLIDGREADTLAGHVDLRRPLVKNEALVALPPSP